MEENITPLSQKSSLPRKLQVSRWIAFLGGCMFIAIGIRHFPLAYQMVHHPEYAKLSTKAASLFILLWLCIGLQLITFGILAIYFSRRLQSKDGHANVFFLCTGLMLLIRIIFEWIYPVVIPTPSSAVMINLIVMALFLFVPYFLARRE